MGASVILLNEDSGAAGRLPCKWPVELWKPLALDPVQAKPVSILPRNASAQHKNSQRRLQTNDEALVDNRSLAGLVDQSDMSPDL